MAYKILFLEKAEFELKELKSYIIKNFSKDIWKDTYDKIKKTINNLKTYPEAGGIPPELAALNLSQYRQIISGKNRIIYEIQQEIIIIHVICDVRKEMKSVLFKRFS